MLYPSEEARKAVRKLVAEFDTLPAKPEGASLAKYNRAVLGLLPDQFDAAASLWGEPIARHVCQTYGGGDGPKQVKPERAPECFSAFVRLIDPHLIPARPAAQSAAPEAQTETEARLAKLESEAAAAKLAEKAEHLRSKLWDMADPFDSVSAYDDLQIPYVPPELGDYLFTGLVRMTVGDFDAPSEQGLQELESFLRLPLGSDDIRRLAAEKPRPVDEYDAAIAAATSAYNAKSKAIEAEYSRAHAPIQERYNRAERSGDERTKKAAFSAYGRAIKPHEDKLESAHEAAEAEYNEAVRIIEEKRADAIAAQAAEYEERERERELAEEQRAAAEAAADKAAREMRAAQAKRAKRERVAAQYEEAERKLTEGPAETMTPRQAAARVGLTMAEFWAQVRSGKYPAPNDANLYDRDAVERLPRPKVARRKPVQTTPSNVLTDIMKF